MKYLFTLCLLAIVSSSFIVPSANDKEGKTFRKIVTDCIFDFKNIITTRKVGESNIHGIDHNKFASSVNMPGADNYIAECKEKCGTRNFYTQYPDFADTMAAGKKWVELCKMIEKLNSKAWIVKKPYEGRINDSHLATYEINTNPKHILHDDFDIVRILLHQYTKNGKIQLWMEIVGDDFNDD
jgi:hypothetical protein